MPKTRQQIQEAATFWMQQAKEDLREKIEQVLQMSHTTPQVLAESLGVSTDQIVRIIHGDGNITLDTFAKILIATDNALQITPVEVSPIGSYTKPMRDSDIADHGSFYDEYPTFDDNVPPMHHHHRMPPPPPPSEFMGGMPPFGGPRRHMCGHQGAQPQSPHREVPRHHGVNTPPFASMSRDELERIISSKLWDSEIDMDNASRAELIRFLEEKDRRFKAFKNVEERSREPQTEERRERLPEGVEAMRNKLKEQLRKNPSLRSILESILEE